MIEQQIKIQVLGALFSSDLNALPELLTQAEAARFFEVESSTVKRWIEKGKIYVDRSSGRKRIRREDVILSPFYRDVLISKANKFCKDIATKL